MSLRQHSPYQRTMPDLDRSRSRPGRRAMLTGRKLWKTAALAFPVMFVAQWLLLFGGAVLLEKLGFAMAGSATMAFLFLAGVAAALVAVLHKRWGTTARAFALSAGVSAILIAAQISEL